MRELLAPIPLIVTCSAATALAVAYLTASAAIAGAGAGAGACEVPRIPSVGPGSHEVEGHLPKDMIRRIVRAHINEVRSCYNDALVGDPELGGTVETRFEISAEGIVTESSVVESTLDHTETEMCIAHAIERWKFPKPRGGGTVSVVYPFKLSPG